MPNPRKPRPECRCCGVPAARPNSVYCSLRCQDEYTYRTFITRWLTGEVEGSKVGGVSNYIRRYLMQTYGGKCARCGWCERNPTTGRIPVELDHIDGDWRNNRLENLRLLSPNCHALTPTFRGLNRGRGRDYRSQK